VVGGTYCGWLNPGDTSLTWYPTYSKAESGVQLTCFVNDSVVPFGGVSPVFTVNRVIDHFHVGADSPQEEGVAFPLTVTVQDASHNTITEDNKTVVTLDSPDGGHMQFDGNGNGTFGEAGDNVLTLTNGTFTISVKDDVGETRTLRATGNGKTGGKLIEVTWRRGPIFRFQ
jgi:hypothetical protein